MKHMRRASVVTIAVMLLACSSGSGDGDANEGSGNAGSGGGNAGSDGRPGNHQPAEHNTPVGIAEVNRCGSSCTADENAGRQALSSGNFAAALEAYKCANTPAAAFGAGLARLMTAIEGEGADGLLADLGLPPMQASVLLGPESLMHEVGSRWNGQGQITITGALNLTSELRVMHDRYSEEELDAAFEDSAPSPFIELTLDAVDASGAADVRLEIWRSAQMAALTAESHAVSYDCATGMRVSGDEATNVSLSLTQNGIDYYCSPPFLVDTASCETDGGALALESPGLNIGELASYRLTNLLLECDPESGSDDDGLAPSAPGVLVRVSAEVSATTVDSNLDASEFHPLFEGAWEAVPESSTLTDALRHAEQMAAEIAEAACFFDLAGRGTGTVFTLPGDLYGGDDAAVSAGDAQLLSAAALLTLAAAQLGAAYDIDMPLSSLICERVEVCTADGCVEEGECTSEQDRVVLFNTTFARMFHADTFAAAEGVLREGLTRLSRAVDALDEASVITKDASSMNGLLQLKSLADKALESMDAGETVLPDIAPPVLLNLKALFDSPPTREGISLEPLVYEEVCDPDFPDECDVETRMSTEFWSSFLGDALQTDWEAGHEWTGDDESVSGALRGVKRAGILVFE